MYTYAHWDFKHEVMSKTHKLSALIVSINYTNLCECNKLHSMTQWMTQEWVEIYNWR